MPISLCSCFLKRAPTLFSLYALLPPLAVREGGATAALSMLSVSSNRSLHDSIITHYGTYDLRGCRIALHQFIHDFADLQDSFSAHCAQMQCSPKTCSIWLHFEASSNNQSSFQLYISNRCLGSNRPANGHIGCKHSTIGPLSYTLTKHLCKLHSLFCSTYSRRRCSPPSKLGLQLNAATNTTAYDTATHLANWKPDAFRRAACSAMTKSLFLSMSSRVL